MLIGRFLVGTLKDVVYSTFSRYTVAKEETHS